MVVRGSKKKKSKGLNEAKNNENSAKRDLSIAACSVGAVEKDPVSPFSRTEEKE